MRYKKPLYCDDGIFYSVTGEREEDEFMLDYPDRGGVALKKIGVKPVYAKIQAEKVNCDLQSVLESVVHESQSSVIDLGTMNDIIADFTIPKSLGDLYSGMKEVENTWSQLPLEVRESFNSDVRSFVRDIGSDDFNAKVSAGYKSFYDKCSKRVLVNNDVNVSNSQVVDQTDHPDMIDVKSLIKEVE